MAFEKKARIVKDVSTVSIPDIVFLLLMFFMVTTTFRTHTGLPVDLPTAKKIQKLEAKKNVVSIWANANRDISIDDKLINQMSDIRQIMYPKIKDNPRLIVSMKIDKAANMGMVTGIQQELREVNALRVNYTAKYGD